jgi:hypothetical protein
LYCGKDRLLRWPGRAAEYVGLAFADCKGKCREDVGDKIQEQDLQRQQRQRQAEDHGETDDEDLSEIAGQQIQRKAPDSVEDDTAFPHRLDDRREGEVPG